MIVRLALLLLTAAAAVLVTAVPAQAHATLIATVPPAGYAVGIAPDRIALVFDEPVAISGDALALRPRGGARWRISPARLSADRRRVSVLPADPLTPGAYTVHWRITAQDGDVITGSFVFAVAAPDQAAAQVITRQDDSGRGAGPDPTAVLRWLLFAALALALGGLSGDRLVQRCHAQRTQLPPRPRPPVRLGSALGLVASGGLVLVIAGDGPAVGLTSNWPGILALSEAVAFTLALVLAVPARTRPLSGIPLVAVILAEGLRSHPPASPTASSARSSSRSTWPRPACGSAP